MTSNMNKSAIILAAGYGTRMAPININTPKALIEIKGEPLIERLIKQLNDAGINKIYIVVGFMKERLKYLEKKFKVNLIFNPYYAKKNNLYSLYLAREHLKDCYIVPSDIYCIDNPFGGDEDKSWYLLSDELKDNTGFSYINESNVQIKNSPNQNVPIGITYVSENNASLLKCRLEEFANHMEHNNDFWERILYQDNKLIFEGKIISKNKCFEINTYEQLRSLDKNSTQLKSDAIDIIKEVLNVKEDEIISITSLKKGMTNCSFLFECRGKKYIMRIPGKGTDLLINRAEESEVYHLIKNKNISDNVLYLNPKNGYKITEYIENSRCCNPGINSDLIKCMTFLKKFHSMNLKVSHQFDIFKQIELYERLCNRKESVYKDYCETKKNIFSLKDFIEKNVQKKCLTHIDAVPDNFLIYQNENDEENVRLIDFEYSGMQDPHVDIAMFCIYSLYDKKQIDHLIDIYFENKCPRNIRIKIYCYIACCGLLWSNWCEYKKTLKIEFGNYALAQYQYAKDFYKIAKTMMEDNNG